MGDPFCTDKSADFRHSVTPAAPAAMRAPGAETSAGAPRPGMSTSGFIAPEKPASVALFNVKYSANLGDGLIAAAMEDGLSRSGVAVETCDLAGRRGFGDQTLQNRKLALAILHALPPGFRGAVVEARLRPKLEALAPAWRAVIASSDHVVIGGGHLFQDGDLNFPLKIGAVLDLAREQAKPVSVHAVGVTDAWSARGRELFHRLLGCDVGQITVRDADSQRAWARHFRGTRLEQVGIAPDPVIGYRAEPAESSGHVALGVTHPRVLAYHGTSAPRIRQFYTAILRELAARGRTVTVFSNGATEDEQQVDAIFAEPAIRRLTDGGKIIRAAAPRQPDDLVTATAPAAVVIAHRLHANILAYALGTPSIGLAWDPKLDSFFKLTGRSDFLFSADGLDPVTIADAVETAQRSGLDEDLRANLKSQADDSLRTLAEEIVDCSLRRGADQ